MVSDSLCEDDDLLTCLLHSFTNSVDCDGAPEVDRRAAQCVQSTWVLRWFAGIDAFNAIMCKRTYSLLTALRVL